MIFESLINHERCKKHNGHCITYEFYSLYQKLFVRCHEFKNSKNTLYLGATYSTNMELLILFLAILFIILATVRFKMNPVLSLTIAAIFSGLLLGMDAPKIVSTLGEGFGKTLSGIGLVIAFGTIIGVFFGENGEYKGVGQFHFVPYWFKTFSSCTKLGGFCGFHSGILRFWFCYSLIIEQSLE